LESSPKLLIAFSGGCDSTFLLAAARRVLGRGAILAVTGVSASLTETERRLSAALAQRLDAEHLFLTTDEFANPSYTSNPSNRCFFCKDELFSRLAPIAHARGMKMADGLNASDRADFRPGVQAAAEWGVLHPLDAADLSKRDIRIFSRWLGLPTWNKPASPCLSSRIPYGTAVTPMVLRQVERAEAFLHEEGFKIVRVRHFGEEARIEVPAESIERLQNHERRRRIDLFFRAAGFLRITIDERGFKSGRLNEKILARS
jgi:pyridinium-3,5-biscarboxylic acid mononucleotide sulfurtransferase